MSLTDSPEQVRRIARLQRLLMQIELAQFVAVAISFALEIWAEQTRTSIDKSLNTILMMVIVGIGLGQFGAMFNLGRALGHRRAAYLYAFIGLWGCLALPVVLLLNHWAMGRLRRAGLQPGFLGVPQDDLERYMASHVVRSCSSCGEPVVGTSAACQMCGATG